jgi:hypothetical protein
MRNAKAAIAARNDAIIAARRAGQSLHQIAEALGVHKTTVKYVCRHIEPEKIVQSRRCLKCDSMIGWHASHCKNCQLQMSVEPEAEKEPKPTEHPPGTLGRIEEMRRRVENGEKLFCEEDRDHYEGMVGGVEPRGCTTLGDKLGRRDVSPASTEFVRFVKAVSQ